MYLGSLPEPLLTFGLYKEFCDAYGSRSRSHLTLPSCFHFHVLVDLDQAKQGPKLKELVEKLPKSNYQLLRYLVEFFIELQKHEAENLMSFQNISICVNPRVFYSLECVITFLLEQMYWLDAQVLFSQECGGGGAEDRHDAEPQHLPGHSRERPNRLSRPQVNTLALCPPGSFDRSPRHRRRRLPLCAV